MRFTLDDFSLDRSVGEGRHHLGDIARGLEKSPPIVALLGGEAAADAFLDTIAVELVARPGYMWVDNENGTLFSSLPYWREGDLMGVYLDLCHEIVHVKQQREGRDLYDSSYAYVDRPTELEAYRVTVSEARRLGMSERDLCVFLEVPWISREEHKRLCDNLGVPFVRPMGTGGV